uniref:Uncharacterized protein n=1 Tax=Marseillevirus LCMAC202 TaxID=2506606 RepID=A0A481YXP4_9VIRU|nr:MAG: uncharacterized protein LCMAC202_03740 [Marseillevirus LCMAC202]
MQFCDIVGFSTYYEVEGNSFYKYYDNINDEHWIRIKNVARILSNEGLGPKVFSITDDNNYHCIEYQRITPFNAHNDKIRPNMSTKKIRDKISSLVDRLHSLGYGHGDLHLENIGFQDDTLYILDHDTIYRIEEGQVKWLLLWMKKGFGWEDSFEDFVEDDYDSWMSDWICK